MPHRKWRIPLSFNLPYTPKNYERLLLNSLVVKEFSMRDVKRRIDSLDKLFVQIIKKIRAEIRDFPKNPYVYTYQNSGIQQLLKKTVPDLFIKKLSKILTIEECQQVHAVLSLNLVNSQIQAKKIFQKQNSLLNENTRLKILKYLK